LYSPISQAVVDRVLFDLLEHVEFVLPSVTAMVYRYVPHLNDPTAPWQQHWSASTVGELPSSQRPQDFWNSSLRFAPERTTSERRAGVAAFAVLSKTPSQELLRFDL